MKATDLQLLQRYVSLRDESAFAEVVKRHGPLVQGVCQRVLGDHAGADDAFQMTFVTLARQAPGLTQALFPGDAVAGWLYRVAFHAALHERRQARVRRRYEQAAAHPASITTAEDGALAALWQEVVPILDEELHALPIAYQAPLVLCHLDGKTQARAARELGLTFATLRRNLARARVLLRRRLAQRGVILTSLVLTTLLWRAAEGATAASVRNLVASTTSAALASGALSMAKNSAAAASGTWSSALMSVWGSTQFQAISAGLLFGGGVIFGTQLMSTGSTASATPGQTVSASLSAEPLTQESSSRNSREILAPENSETVTSREAAAALDNASVVKTDAAADANEAAAEPQDLAAELNANPVLESRASVNVRVEADGTATAEININGQIQRFPSLGAMKAGSGALNAGPALADDQLAQAANEQVQQPKDGQKNQNPGFVEQPVRPKAAPSVPAKGGLFTQPNGAKAGPPTRSKQLADAKRARAAQAANAKVNGNANGQANFGANPNGQAFQGQLPPGFPANFPNIGNLQDLQNLPGFPNLPAGFPDLNQADVDSFEGVININGQEQRFNNAADFQQALPQIPEIQQLQQFFPK